MADLINTTYNFGSDSDQVGWFATSFPANSEHLNRNANDYPNGDTNFPEQITTSANYASGLGGRGQRHWIYDTLNANSGGVAADFVTPRTELWIRCYIRFQSGFRWANNAHCKLLYLHTSAPYCAPGFVNGKVGIQTSLISSHDSTLTWDSLMGGTDSDGQWHCYEWYVKMDTNGSDGIGAVWVDNVQYLNNTSSDWGTGTGWDSMEIGNNHNACANATGPIGSAFAYIDYDDLVVSNSGRVGPLATGTTVGGWRAL